MSIRKGYTIVEALVVVVVLAILITLSAVGVARYQAMSRDAQRLANVTVIAEALEKYYDKNGEYPSCQMISDVNVQTVTTSVLPGVDQSAFMTPRNKDAQNAVTCNPLTPPTDAYAYIGDGSAACLMGSSCLNWKIEYLKEQDSTVAFLSSRRNAVVATSGKTTLNATALSAKEISVSWGTISNAIGYTVQYSTTSNFLSNLKEKDVTGTSAVINGLEPMTQYFFRVRARASGSVGLWSNTATATTMNNYGSLAVGTSIDGYWTTAPEGFLIEDGRAVSRITYADLFAVIGTTFGAGDGSTTFNLPDSRGRVSVTQNPSDVEFATVGQKTGSKTEALTIAQIPSHTHVQNAHTHSVTDPGHNHAQNPHSHTQNVGVGTGSGGIRRDYNSDGAGGIYPQGTPTDHAWPTNNPAATGVTINSATAVNQSTGGGGTHLNIQPSIVKMAAIKYTRPDTDADSFPAGTTIQGYWTTAPEGYVLENGAALSRTTYAELFAAIGTTYGAGNGSTTFNVPDSRGRVGVNRSTSDTEFDVLGEKSGSKTEQLTIAQLPSHTHTQNAHNHGVTDPGHNHTQNPHSHGHEVSANSGGSAIRRDWGSDGNTTAYAQGISTESTTALNNPSTTGISLASTTATNQSTGGGGTHNNIQPSIVKQSAIKVTAAKTGSSTPAAAPGTSVSGWWSSVPAGYLLEDGSAVSRTTYAALFSVIGTTYGAGNGSTTFNLPDSRGRVGVHRNTSDTEFDTMGEKTGAKTVTLTIAQIPSHTHVQNAHTHSVTDPKHNHTQVGHNHPQMVSSPLAGGTAIRNDYKSDGNGLYYSQGITTGTTTATNKSSKTNVTIANATATNQSTGGGGAHNNIQPSITKLFVIKY